MFPSERTRKLHRDEGWREKVSCDRVLPSVFCLPRFALDDDDDGDNRCLMEPKRE